MGQVAKFTSRISKIKYFSDVLLLAAIVVLNVRSRSYFIGAITGVYVSSTAGVVYLKWRLSQRKKI